MHYIICTFVITDDTAPNGDGASVIAMVHLQTPYSYGTRLLRVKYLTENTYSKRLHSKLNSIALNTMSRRLHLHSMHRLGVTLSTRLDTDL